MVIRYMGQGMLVIPLFADGGLFYLLSILSEVSRLMETGKGNLVVC
jgi:hypothetical protein